MTYDQWKLATPPEYEDGSPEQDDLRALQEQNQKLTQLASELLKALDALTRWALKTGQAGPSSPIAIALAAIAKAEDL